MTEEQVRQLKGKISTLQRQLRDAEAKLPMENVTETPAMQAFRIIAARGFDDPSIRMACKGYFEPKDANKVLERKLRAKTDEAAYAKMQWLMAREETEYAVTRLYNFMNKTTIKLWGYKSRMGQMSSTPACWMEARARALQLYYDIQKDYDTVEDWGDSTDMGMVLANTMTQA